GAAGGHCREAAVGGAGAGGQGPHRRADAAQRRHEEAMKPLVHSARISCLVLGVLLAAWPAAPQPSDSLSSARDLYAAAAYEDSLAMLNRLKGVAAPGSRDQGIEQYRALCLLALGRAAEA